jgi:hypothetical protein
MVTVKLGSRTEMPVRSVPAVDAATNDACLPIRGADPGWQAIQGVPERFS